MLTPKQVVDEYYLEVRCKLLEIAAILDRYERAKERDPSSAIDDDPRLAKCRASLDVLTSPQPESNRAEQVALVFSDPALEPGAY